MKKKNNVKKSSCWNVQWQFNADNSHGNTTCHHIEFYSPISLFSICCVILSDWVRSFADRSARPNFGAADRRNQISKPEIRYTTTDEHKKKKRNKQKENLRRRHIVYLWHSSIFLPPLAHYYYYCYYVFDGQFIKFTPLPTTAIGSAIVNAQLVVN